ncbi:MAG TPA: outer membrane beta-barrel protein [Flavitalea sp.]|nr:outer membrane beta-barrel protein [Flavitalea sp.]
MRLVLLTWFLTLLTFAKAYSQKSPVAVIRGTIMDSVLQSYLESATISVFEAKDSTLFNYTFSDIKGGFLFRGVPVQQQLKLIISFNGYKTISRFFYINKEQKEFRFDTFYLVKSYTELDEVIVTAERPPVIFKKDTVEFNAGSFKTRPNAVVEDLLKQLPGVEVDADGNITVNGKAVSKITVDGKDFFGGDPKIATKNLPKDIVDKIQVTDNRTKEAIFNKTIDGTEDKAINITLKKNKNSGWFGRATAGYGSQERYEAGASINYFKGKNQLNFIGSANNTNRMNFGNGNNNRGNNGNGGNGPGITASGSAGVNFGTEAGKKFRINGSYFYNQTSTVNSTRRKRENILPDTSFYYISDNKTKNKNQGHNLSVNGDVELDSVTQLNFQTAVNMRDGWSLADNNSFSEDLKGNRINSSNTDYLSNNRGNSISGNLFVSRRLNTKGRGVSFTIGYNDNDNKAVSDNIGLNIYNIAGSIEADSLNQRGNDKNTGSSFNAAVAWSEPITKELNVLLRTAYSISNNVSDRRTYDLNGISGKYDIEDSALTNAFRNRNESLQPGITFNFNREKLRVSVGNSISFLRQDNFSVTRDSLMRQRFMNFFPTANFGYSISKTSHINFNYNGRTQQPSIQQLQPVADNRNPLYIRLGNPDLQPSFTHSLGLNINAQKIEKKIFLYGGINYNSTTNQIVQEVYYDSAGRQISRPVNTNGNYNGSVYISYGKNWKKKDWSLKVNSNTSINLGRNTFLSNKIENRANSYGVSETFSFTFDLNDKFDIRPQYSIRFNDTKYSIEQKGQVASSITQNLAVSVNCDITKKIIFETDISTNYNNRIAAGFRKSVTNWSAAINLKMFKKDQGNLRFIIYDILKQNTSVYRNISQTFIEDVQMDVLQQCFLVSFTYNLKKFGKM